VYRTTYDRVRFILQEGSEEQIESIRRNPQDDAGATPTEDPGVRTVYEQPKFEKLESRPRSTLLRMKNLKA